MLPLFALAFLLSGTSPIASDSARADEETRLVVLRNASEVRHCYEREGLRRNPELVGTVELSLTVLPTGMVDEATVSTSEMHGAGSDEVSACIATSARNWRFERGPFGIETLIFPFRLVPQDVASQPAAKSS